MTSLQNLPIYNNLQATYKFKIHNFAKFTSYNFKVYKFTIYNKWILHRVKRGRDQYRVKMEKKKLISISIGRFNEDEINVCVVLCIPYH